MKLIAISGGIGSGKSVVAAMLRAMGHEVYDCDSRAKKIMDSDSAIISRIASEVCAEAVVCGSIDRRRLAEVVFSDAHALSRLNSIVHGAVRSDRSLAFVETAILYQSGLDRMVNEVWQVVAPLSLRLGRAMRRDNASEQAVRARIATQDSHIPVRVHPCVREIVNDEVEPLLPQLLSLLHSE